MASLSVQLHATLEELGQFAASWLEDNPVHAVAIEYRPFALRVVTGASIRDEIRNPRVRRIAFTEGPTDCTASGNNEFLDRNDGSLVLDIGREGPIGLSGSGLSTTVLTPAWRRISKSLKTLTAAGLVGTHDQSGATGDYRHLRYTPGARDLSEAGVPLRPFEQSPVSLRPAE